MRRAAAWVGALALLSIVSFGLVPTAQAEPAAGPAVAESEHKGSISGQVTDEAGFPVAGVEVAAYPNSPYYTAGTRSTTSDLGGWYTIDGIEPGFHFVRFLPRTNQPYRLGWYPTDADLYSGSPVAVRAGQTTSGIDGVLFPGGNASGTVTDNASAAIAGVSVCALSATVGSSLGCLQTDAAGRYAFNNVPVGEYKFSFNSYSQPNYKSEYFDDKATFETANIVTIAPGQTVSGINARLSAATCTAFGNGCTKIVNANGCITASYVSPLVASFSSCTAATTHHWTDNNGHNVMGNPVTLTFSGPGPWTVNVQATVGGSVYSDSIVVQFVGGAPAVPGPPVNVEAVPLPGAARVSWVAPSSDGNATITGYTATAVPGGQTCTWTSGPMSCLVTGLTNGTSVAFTVTATNSVGQGPASAPSPSIKPVGKPSAPSGVVAVAGDGHAVVSWQPSTESNGAPILGYVAQALPGGQTCSAAFGLACSIDGLANGVSTTFVVRAANIVGPGEASAASAAVTPMGLPTAPQSVTGSPLNGKIAVSWQAPMNDGGSDALTYLVSGVPGDVGCETVELTCTISGLTNGTAYTFTVVASNGFGLSPASAPSAPVIPGTPDASASITGTAGKLKATVTWTKPTSPVGAITGYTVQSNVFGVGCTTVVALTCTITGLEEGRSYRFQVVASNAIGAGVPSAWSEPVVPWAGSAYHPLVPTRILDSRGALGGWNGKLSAATPRSLQITGLAGAANIPAGSTAVVLNVTATGSSAGSFLTVWPQGTSKPNASNINFGPNQTIPNLVTVKIGTGGKVLFGTAVGQVDVVADVVGYYDDGIATGDFYNGITPTRLLDSRTALGGWGGKLSAANPKTLSVRAPGNPIGVPSTATAVIANVTVTGSTHGSFLKVWPSGVAQPNASNLNFGPGQTISNLAIVAIGADGALSFATAVGQVDVIVDVVGYFDPTGGSRFHAMAPKRFLDNRVGIGWYGKWGPNETHSVSLAGGGYVIVIAGSDDHETTSTSIVPLGAHGVVMNLTATNATAGSFVTAFPPSEPLPNASNLNFGPGETIANLATVKLDEYRAVSLYNKAGQVDLIGDAVGYYAAT